MSFQVPAKTSSLPAEVYKICKTQFFVLSLFWRHFSSPGSGFVFIIQIRIEDCLINADQDLNPKHRKTNLFGFNLRHKGEGWPLQEEEEG